MAAVSGPSNCRVAAASYLKSTTDEGVHWFSITNSLLVVLLLTGMIAMILIRVVRKDIDRYNDETTLEEAADETGWKLVHSDVFRPPAGTVGPMMLSVFVGSGIQIFMMASTVMVRAWIARCACACVHCTAGA